jgi:GTP pyrophosphokinase
MDDGIFMQLIKKLKYKTATEFYADIASEKIDANWVIDRYVELENRDTAPYSAPNTASAENFVLNTDRISEEQDELIIDQNLTGIEYKLAKCCNPIFGDDIFGFVSSNGIKIHRVNCPNAENMFSRFGYRIVKARWSGKSSGTSNYTTILRVIGNDQINIVSNLMSIISKEEGVKMRSISIDSNDGLFQGNISVSLANTAILEQLIRKLSAVKGVKSISRLN